MLVSEDKKFIFYHIPKNAGVTVSTALAEYGQDSRRSYFHSGINDFKMDDEYYSFAIVRNPWARMVSMYEFCKHQYLNNIGNTRKYKGYNHLLKDFPTWLTETEMWDGGYKTDAIPPVQKRSQSYYISEDGKDVSLDYVFKMEDLEEGVAKVCDTVGIETPKLVPKNMTYTPPYQKYYDDKSKAHVAKHFKWEIDKYDYKF